MAETGILAVLLSNAEPRQDAWRRGPVFSNSPVATGSSGRKAPESLKTFPAQEDGHMDMTKGHYRRLGLMALLSFLAMYALMYGMVNSTSNVFFNLNQLYM